MMTPAPLPLVRDLVLVGGGHSHALVLRMWAMDPLPGVRLTLVNPDPVAPYTGMLPGYVAGHYAREDLMIDLVRLARFAGAELVLDRVVGIERKESGARAVHLAGGGALAFDVASLDIGIGSGLDQVPGFAEHALAAKPLGDFARDWAAFAERKLAFPRVVIIGAGVGGVELALASHHRLRSMGAKPQITLVDRGDAALPGLGSAARQRLLAALQQAGITLITGAAPRAFGQNVVELQDGRSLPADFILTVAGAQPQGWLTDTGLTLHNGFVAVGPTLQSSDPAIFAAGDIAYMTHAPRPKAGVFAVRQAPVLLHNLRAALSGGDLRPYHPQKDYLKLISLGSQTAFADKSGLSGGGVMGKALWRWKDRIDRAFMQKFDTYPAMPAPSLPRRAALGLAEAMGDKPLCGGCGAKVGADDLSRALAHLPRPARADVLSGRGDDAAILHHCAGVQVMTTDHLRSVTENPDLMARIAATHALGDIWAMGAAPQAALAQITLPRLSPALQSRTLARVMEAAASVFTAAGADVVGGHTSLGSELSIGFTVTGLAARAIPKSGAQVGDALILTKPLGSGTILAAEMALARPGKGLMMGEVWASCIATMLRPVGPASIILSPHAHAMTDVTGFGLAGHLLEILQASSLAANLHWPAVPLMAGAQALADQGYGSSIAPANRAAVDWQMTLPLGLDVSLIYDPQTAGGLLAAVPQDQAMGLIQALKAAGETAAIIGHLHAGAPHITVMA